RQVPDEQRKKPRQQRRNVPVKELTPPPAASPTPGASATASAANPADLDEPPGVAPESPVPFTATSMPAEPVTAPPQAVEMPASNAAPVASVIPSPAAATQTSAAAQHVISPRSRAAPWLAAGAAVLAIAGGVLWWNGDQTASDLDARFASGDLSPADNGSYGSARRQSIAGRAMVAGAVVLGAAAVALWW
ncbi:MAG TPA: hypothetical protein VG496_07835, partial [Myxococcales bacterium]|nr:hypothetical protein [Myxococcales bacterium]